jgi:hypothetical protein
MRAVQFTPWIKDIQTAHTVCHDNKKTLQYTRITLLERAFLTVRSQESLFIFYVYTMDKRYVDRTYAIILRDVVI